MVGEVVELFHDFVWPRSVDVGKLGVRLGLGGEEVDPGADGEGLQGTPVLAGEFQDSLSHKATGTGRKKPLALARQERGMGGDKR